MDADSHAFLCEGSETVFWNIILIIIVPGSRPLKRGQRIFPVGGRVVSRV